MDNAITHLTSTGTSNTALAAALSSVGIQPNQHTGAVGLVEVRVELPGLQS
jgi:hypothetical protein